MKKLPLLLVISFLISPPSLITAENYTPEKQSKLIEIAQIGLEAQKKSEQIKITFTTDYSYSPSLQFEVGYFQAILPTTSYDQSISIQRINNQFIRDIRLHHEGNNTIVEVNFADSNLHSEGRISLKSSGKLLTLTILKGHLPELDMGDLNLKNGTLFSENKFDSPDYKTDNSLSGDILKMVLALFLVLLFLYLCLWVYNRYFMTRFKLKKGKHEIKVTSSYYLGPKQKIVILEVDDTSYACGISPNNISVISEVSKNLSANLASYIDSSKRGEVDFNQLRKEYLQAKELKREKTQAKQQKPPKSFPQELMDKVKILKPID
jgi:flagellar biogenesis protein FliO